MEDITSNGASFALVHHGGEGENAVLGDTLVRLAEQVANAIDCSECCIYEYIPTAVPCARRRSGHRSSQRTTSTGSARRTVWRTRPGSARIEDREVLVSYPDDEVDAATAGFETMEYWGERAAIWAPIVYGDQVLGMLELTEKERDRTFTEAEERLVGQMAGVAAIALHNARLSRAAEERNRQLSALDRRLTRDDLDARPGRAPRSRVPPGGARAGRGSSYIRTSTTPRPTPWCGSPSTSATPPTRSRSPSGRSTRSRTCPRTSPW